MKRSFIPPKQMGLESPIIPSEAKEQMKIKIKKKIYCSVQDSKQEVPVSPSSDEDPDAPHRVSGLSPHKNISPRKILS